MCGGKQTSVSDGCILDINELKEIKLFYWQKDLWNEEIPA